MWLIPPATPAVDPALAIPVSGHCHRAMTPCNFHERAGGISRDFHRIHSVLYYTDNKPSNGAAVSVWSVPEISAKKKSSGSSEAVEWLSEWLSEWRIRLRFPT